MFLEPLVRRNRLFVEAAIRLHQQGEIPANSYVLDVDAVRANAERFAEEASRLALVTYPMTKQVGRNPVLMAACADAGLGAFVAVDMADARRIHASGHRVGHVGHLVQVPAREAGAAAGMSPAHWTVFSVEKAREAAEAAGGAGRIQDLLARVHSEGDIFYMGHEGGFPAGEILRVADELDALEGARFSGITSFPALLFDQETGEVRATPNLGTLERDREVLRDRGEDVQVNAPGTTSIEVLSVLASAGATQVEPGHGLTGTTPLHAVRDLPEVPAVCYLSEISHFHGGRAYCFGGGLYIDPVFPDYQVKTLVGSDPEQVLRDRIPATLVPAEAIDYYGLLDVPPGRAVSTGDTVIFGFRIQAFVTRAFVVPITGVSREAPQVEGIWNSDGAEAVWPG